ADKEAALLIKDADFNAGTMNEAIEKLLSDKALREKLCENVKAFAVPDANARIYKELMRIAGKKR
ncbi:MAG: hypothetical protein II135_01080, partial [Clostridia bacterium]|nr:hypothetical protein [Clostridia bacterium]